jgi:hypothetical protein
MSDDSESSTVMMDVGKRSLARLWLADFVCPSPFVLSPLNHPQRVMIAAVTQPLALTPPTLNQRLRASLEQPAPL